VEPRPLGVRPLYLPPCPTRRQFPRHLLVGGNNLIEGILQFSRASQSSTPGDAPRNLRHAWSAGRPVYAEIGGHGPLLPESCHSLSGPVWGWYLEVWRGITSIRFNRSPEQDNGSLDSKKGSRTLSGYRQTRAIKKPVETSGYAQRTSGSRSEALA